MTTIASPTRKQLDRRRAHVCPYCGKRILDSVSDDSNPVQVTGGALLVWCRHCKKDVAARGVVDILFK